MAKLDNNSIIKTHIIRINKVIDYIEQNLDQELSLNILAKKAFYSPYHFHRLFRNLNKETIQQFINRKRIEKIAWLLLKDKSLSIHELVLKYGFSSHTSFSKSFKKYYGLSASNLRRLSKSEFNKILHKNSKIGKEKVSVDEYFYNIKHVKDWMKSNNLKLESKVLQEQKLIIERRQGDFELSNDAFSKLLKLVENEKIIHNNPKQWCLVIHDNPAVTEESLVSHSAGLKLDSELNFISQEMTYLIIPKGRFLIGTFEIDEKDFELAWGGMSIWVMENDFQYRDGYYFEVFHTESVFEKNIKHKVDICIPIE